MPKNKSPLEPIAMLPDLHAPYHDRRGFGLFLQVVKDLKPKHLICIGDGVDFYSVSSHSKDPTRATRLSEELNKIRTDAFDYLHALNIPNKVYIAGNHEDRLRRYLQDKAPELYGSVDVPGLLHLPQFGWTYIPYKQHYKLGKTYYTHDVGVAGRYSAFKALDTYQHTIVTGHSHRMAYIVEGNAVGEFKLSAQFGWLGDSKKIDYMTAANVKKNWPLGFGIGYLDPSTGYTYLTPIPIIRYTCVVNGKMYGKKEEG